MWEEAPDPDGILNIVLDGWLIEVILQLMDLVMRK